MCNEKQQKTNIDIISYRLDRMEQEQQKYHQEVMQTLTALTEGLNEQNKQLIIHEGTIKQHSTDIEELQENKDKIIELKKENETINDTIKLYRNAIITIACTVIASFILQLIHVI